jgi:decaprenylphospho-beta-D-ribofuranose 2-oxidase
MTRDASSISPETLATWGRTRTSRSARVFSNALDQVQQALTLPQARGVITRGLGRSYGDVCLNDDGVVLDLTNGARIRHFDADRGIVECDAGVSLRAITDFALPRGWMLPVCPGTAMVTVGGAIANDIHGKEQHRHGNFGHHVPWLKLVTSDGRCSRISAETDPVLFAATTAGIGLTGVILSAAVQLIPLHSNAMLVEERRTTDIDQLLQLLVTSAPHYTHMVAWVDLLAPGRHVGRGVLELARPADESVPDTMPKRAVTVPFEFPELVLNGATMRMFNEAYFRRIPPIGREKAVHLQRFLFPLDAVQEWHRAYGARGLYQFQFSVSLTRAQAAIGEVVAELQRSRRGSYLSVLKLVGRHGGGMLSFSRPGISLAMDFPGGSESVALIQRLQAIVLRHDGVVYLAKDSCLHAEEFHAMYPRVPEFEDVLNTIDPERRMQSDMARRLRIRGLT